MGSMRYGKVVIIYFMKEFEFGFLGFRGFVSKENNLIRYLCLENIFGSSWYDGWRREFWN